jgi:metal-responsive CopG/Arc/MetJ family transcriptional regulator
MAITEKVTLTLPKDLMENIREIAPRGGYSKFVAEAIEYFIETKRRKELRERLINGYQVNAARDAAVNKEWEAVDDEAWLRYVPPCEGDEPTNDTTNPAR